ncbi:unnamed protein product, partial [Didymodactylos carnosus]
DSQKGVLLKTITTPKSILNIIDEKVKTTAPTTVYRESIGSCEGITTIKNAKQIQNRRNKYLQKFKLSHDELFSTYEIGLQNKTFVQQLTFIPHLLVICAHDKSIEIFNRLLETTTTPIILAYDTTFNLTDGYVRFVIRFIFDLHDLKYVRSRDSSLDSSSLIYRHTAFVQSPSIVLAYMIHETKEQRSHLQMIQTLKYLCPKIGINCVLVTDNEKAFKNCFAQEFPALLQFRCWNHMMKNIYRRVMKTKTSEEEEDQETQVVDDDNQHGSRSSETKKILSSHLILIYSFTDGIQQQEQPLQETNDREDDGNEDFNEDDELEIGKKPKKAHLWLHHAVLFLRNKRFYSHT